MSRWVPPRRAVDPQELSRLTAFAGRRGRKRRGRHLAQASGTELGETERGSAARSFRSLFNRSVTPGFVILILLGAASSAIGLVLPYLVGSLVDEILSGSGYLEVLRSFLFKAIAVVGAQCALTYLYQWQAVKFGLSVSIGARIDLVGRVLRHWPVLSATGRSGDLATKLTRDATIVSEALRLSIPELVIATVTLILTVVAMVLNASVLSIPLLISVAILGFCGAVYFRSSTRAYSSEADNYAQLNDALLESVDGAVTSDSLGLGDQRLNSVRARMSRSADAEEYSLSLRSRLFFRMELLIGVAFLATVLFGLFGFTSGRTTIGQLSAALIYLQGISDPLNRMFQSLDSVQLGAASARRILWRPLPEELGGRRTDRSGHVFQANSEVELSGVSFLYPDAQKFVLRDVNINIGMSEFVAVVGPSGAGKTTLALVLAGLVEPTVGAVYRSEMAEVPQSGLPHPSTFIPQERHVFSGSLRYNVLLGVLENDDSEIEAALSRLGAHHWLESLPEGLDTIVGGGGVSLTRAQSEQLMMARLILAQPAYVVLDEPFLARQDGQVLTGQWVRAALPDATVIAVVHDLQFASVADRVILLVNGEVHGDGSHDLLLRSNSTYQMMWSAFADRST